MLGGRTRPLVSGWNSKAYTCHMEDCEPAGPNKKLCAPSSIQTLIFGTVVLMLQNEWKGVWSHLGTLRQHEYACGDSQLIREAATEVKVFCLTTEDKLVLLCWSHSWSDSTYSPSKEPRLPSAISVAHRLDKSLVWASSGPRGLCLTNLYEAAC